MKAYSLIKPMPVENRPLILVERTIPEPQAGQLLIRVNACGICRTDLHVVEGELPVHKVGITPGHQVVGEIAKIGPGCDGFSLGMRVGVAWLHATCECCSFCTNQQENLCENADFTGWTTHGGFAEYMVAKATFVYPLPPNLSDIEVAPLLCAGIIGYRALQLTGIDQKTLGWKGARLGIYGFGAAGHLALQLAIAWGAQGYVFTRDHERHQRLAKELGAYFVGSADTPAPDSLDAAIIFAPGGQLVPVALKALKKAGTLILAGIYMSPIPTLDYQDLYHERIIRSVTNNTRRDGLEFFQEAAKIDLHSHTQVFSFDHINEALLALKKDGIKGAGVIQVR